MTKAERIVHKAKMDAIYARNRQIVAEGICPQCGSKLRLNRALPDWWQCEQYGSEQFRARPAEPPCSFQI